MARLVTLARFSAALAAAAVVEVEVEITPRGDPKGPILGDPTALVGLGLVDDEPSREVELRRKAP